MSEQHGEFSKNIASLDSAQEQVKTVWPVVRNFRITTEEYLQKLSSLFIIEIGSCVTFLEFMACEVPQCFTGLVCMLIITIIRHSPLQ